VIHVDRAKLGCSKNNRLHCINRN